MQVVSTCRVSVCVFAVGRAVVWEEGGKGVDCKDGDASETHEMAAEMDRAARCGAGAIERLSRHGAASAGGALCDRRCLAAEPWAALSLAPRPGPRALPAVHADQSQPHALRPSDVALPAACIFRVRSSAPACDARAVAITSLTAGHLWIPAHLSSPLHSIELRSC